jgi:hypothetical protein
MKVLRNSVMAHSDGRRSFEDWFKQANITYNEMRDLTEKTMEAVNLLRTANGQDEMAFHDLHVEDLEALLEMIQAQPQRR